MLSDPDLRPEALAGRIDTLAAGPIDAPPLEALTRLLVQIEEQSNQPLAQDDPGAWSRQMLGRVIDWLGSGLSLPGVNAVQQRRSPLTRALESAAAQLAQEWADRLLGVVKGLMEHSGRRVAVAEAAVAELIRFCDEAMQVNAAQQQRSARSGQYQEQLDSAVENCHNGSGGWSLFGGRSRRLLRVFTDHLAAFARQCVVEDTAAAVLQFFAALRGRLADRMRDLGYCRQCLRSLQHNLTAGEAAPEDVDSVVDTVTFSRTPAPNPLAPQAPSRLLASTGEPATALWATEAYWQTIRESQTARVVLPDGVKDLEVAARRFLRSLTAEHWTQLDQTLGDQVLAARGGLMQVCLDSGDILRYFASPLLIHALRLLSDHLPITDVAQVEVAAAETLAQRIVGYHNRAVPLVATPPPAAQPQPHAGVGSGVRQAVLIGSAAEDVAATDFRPNLAPRPAAATPRPQDAISYLLVPASDAGKEFGERAREQVPELQLVNVPGQADLTFCREQVGLRIEDLERLLAPCRNAYHESCLTPQSSPHARFDIHDWTPLDP